MQIHRSLFAESGKEAPELFTLMADLLRAEHSDLRRLKRGLLRRVEVAGAEQGDLGLRDGRGQLRSISQQRQAAASQCSERHPTEVAARRRVRRVEVAVGVDPDNAADGAVEPANGADGGQAVS